MLSTLLLPTSGTATVGGYDVVRQDRQVRRQLGVVLGGDRGLYPRLTGRDNLVYFGNLDGLTAATLRRRVDEMLSLVGLRDRAGDRVEGYSRGMKQRLHLAKALLHDPPILILDEPTIGLDPAAAVELRQALAALVPRHTVLLTTHDMHEADQLCREIAIIDRGTIVAQGSPAALKAQVAAERRIIVVTRRELDGRTPPVAGALAPARRARRRPGRRRTGRDGLDAALRRHGARPRWGAGGAAPSRRRPQRCPGGRADAGGCLPGHHREGAGMRSADPVAFRGPFDHWWAVVTATAVAYGRRMSAYLIDIIRIPLYPLLTFAIWRIAYTISGQEQVDDAGVAGFLLVGMVGLITWNSTIWSSGYAIEYERAGGTAAALFLSPAWWRSSRLGSLVRLAVALSRVVMLLALATGAVQIAEPGGAGGAGAVVRASLATGFAFAGLFILSRRANLLANFLQAPIYLLAGFIVPRTSLPDWLQPLAALVPAGHAIDALRAATLRGADLADITTPLVLALATSAGYALAGIISLRRVEHAAKRSGQLDLY
jgi:ABC-2 type transport system ATP-binding protein